MPLFAFVCRHAIFDFAASFSLLAADFVAAGALSLMLLPPADAAAIIIAIIFMLR